MDKQQAARAMANEIVRLNPNLLPNPHMYQVWDAKGTPSMVAQFHDRSAAVDYAVQVRDMNGYTLQIRKGEYAR